MADVDTEPTEVTYADRGWWVAVEFEIDPKFAYAPQAIAISKSHPGHKKLYVLGRGVVYRNSYRENQMKFFWELWSMICNQTPYKVYVCGKELDSNRINYYSPELRPPKKGV